MNNITFHNSDALYKAQHERFIAIIHREKPRTQAALLSIFMRCHPRHEAGQQCKICVTHAQMQSDLVFTIFQTSVERERPKTVHHLTRILEAACDGLDAIPPLVRQVYNAGCAQIEAQPRMSRAKKNLEVLEFFDLCKTATDFLGVEQCYRYIIKKHAIGPENRAIIKLIYDSIEDEFDRLIKLQDEYADACLFSFGSFAAPIRISTATPETLLQKAVENVKKKSQFATGPMPSGSPSNSASVSPASSTENDSPPSDEAGSDAPSPPPAIVGAQANAPRMKLADIMKLPMSEEDVALVDQLVQEELDEHFEQTDLRVQQEEIGIRDEIADNILYKLLGEIVDDLNAIDARRALRRQNSQAASPAVLPQ